jgi:NAD-dependent DNA ligase adenylation domain
MGQSLISDHDYDVLFAELQKLEKENPKLASKNSPTKKYPAFFLFLFIFIYCHLFYLELELLLPQKKRYNDTFC